MVANFSNAKLFVFDLDGTLADTSQDIAVTLQETWEDFGFGTIAAETVISHIGHGAEHLIQSCLRASRPKWPVEIAEFKAVMSRFLSRYAAEPSRFARPYEGVFDLLQALDSNPQHILAVLTNKPIVPAEGLLQALQMRHFFKGVLGGDSGFGLKPDITGLLHFMEEFACPSDSTCLIGDGPQDAETAKKANIRFYGFLGGIGKVQPQPDSAKAQFFGTFPELLPLLLPQA